MDTIGTSSVISSVQQKKPIKITNSRKKNNNKPIKVVYISNPMKVKTSASEFMALVQELTGQYAESPPDPSKFQDYGSDNSVADSESWCENIKMGCDDENDHAVAVVPPIVDSNNQVVKAGGGFSYEGFDEDVLLTPEMVENIWDLLPTSAFYEPSQLYSS